MPKCTCGGEIRAHEGGPVFAPVLLECERCDRTYELRDMRLVPAGKAGPWEDAAKSLALSDAVALPPGREVEYVHPPMFDMLMSDWLCADCEAELPRGAIVYNRSIGPWHRIRHARGVRLSRARAWRHVGPMAATEPVCPSCAAADLLPQHDEKERQRIIETAQARLAEHRVVARAVVNGITWVARLSIRCAEWMPVCVSQTEVLPGCRHWGDVRYTAEQVWLDIDGVPARVQSELERELWLELEIRGAGNRLGEAV